MSTNEKMPTGPTQEEKEEAQYSRWMRDNPEPVILPEDLVESGPEIVELERMIDLFESKYPLEELYSIVDLTPEEASEHPVRRPAWEALKRIVDKRNFIKEKTNIAPEKYEELEARFKNISRAVGMINSNDKVDHDRG